MKTEILYRPSAALARCTLSPNETLRVEGGSMVGMSPEVTLETKAHGGFLTSLARSMFGGESFFQNTYTAGSRGGELLLAPALPGDMFAVDVAGTPLLVQSGSYVASGGSIETETGWGGAKSFFAAGTLVMLRIKGSGPLLLSCYGAIHELQLSDGQAFTIDTGHVVAFEEHMQQSVRKVGGIKSTLFSGEGLVVDLKGPGRVYLQTRSVDAFMSWLFPKIPHPEAVARTQ
jgi:uncharacterized protein (TIGR00266 family)